MRLKKWEIALLAGLLLSAVITVAAAAKETDLAGKVVRLHVLADSDSEYDQSVKLKVRDSVIEAAEPLLKGCKSSEDARNILMSNLETIELAGREALEEEGCYCDIRAELEETAFPTREYDGFSLPAGKYTALRVIIGSGQGQNWWCVVFPPLCEAAATGEFYETAEAAGLTDDDVRLISQDGSGYVIKFKFLEWLGSIRNKLGW